MSNIITPCAVEGACGSRMLPRDRAGAHQLIKRYLRLKPAVLAEINAFAASRMAGPMIGLHIRGPGRIGKKGGDIRASKSPDGRVPYELYFASVDKALETWPDAKILICSDSSVVIDTVQAHFRGRVVLYDATRSVFGEMHAKREENAGQVFPKHKLGLDVLVEAYLLSRCDFFVHGISNVTNFVLCNAPDMPHSYIEA